MASSVQSKKIQLPSPITRGDVSLEETLSKRRSIRAYTRDPLSVEEVSQLLWAAQGLNHEELGRTAPSAGATYPLEVYIVVNRVEGLDSGLYHYSPAEHVLEIRKAGSFSKELEEAALRQGMVEAAAVNIILTAVYERTTARYKDRGIRYVQIEVGHVGQNICLQAEALGLGTVAVGAFHDGRVRTLLEINEEILYIMPVGQK